MDFVRKQPGISLLIVFAVGFFIGLVLFGWWLTPVQWVDATPDALSQTYQDHYLRAVADSFSQDNDTTKVQQALGSWNGADAACESAARQTDQAAVQRLSAIAAVMNGTGCPGVTAAPITGVPGETAPVAEEEGGNSLFSIFFLALLLVILILAIFFVLSRRRSIQNTGGTFVMPESAPVYDENSAVGTTPIASVDTTYAWGDDRFEYSFPIESQGQDFLGDCGIAIAESIGAGSPRNVTAFEVWLFDKNDIRTRTKILMSDHAFFDEGLKAKLATKGAEQILAQENQTIVLETISLILNAVITSMEYGQEASLPPKSYFERLSIKFHVWSKEGDFAPADIEGRVQELRQSEAADDAFDF